MSATFPIAPFYKNESITTNFFLVCCLWLLLKSTLWADFVVVMAPT
jgi:hypothetical protein